jgi:hypothetical protein
MCAISCWSSAHEYHSDLIVCASRST